MMCAHQAWDHNTPRAIDLFGHATFDSESGNTSVESDLLHSWQGDDQVSARHLRRRK